MESNWVNESGNIVKRVRFDGHCIYDNDLWEGVFVDYDMESKTIKFVDETSMLYFEEMNAVPDLEKMAEAAEKFVNDYDILTDVDTEEEAFNQGFEELRVENNFEITITPASDLFEGSK